MVAVYGNLMVMGIAVALFVATLNLGRKRNANAEETSRAAAADRIPETSH